jgi:negative regulator of sigma E activity
MPTMPPGEPAEEPFLRVVRRPADERRATCHAPGHRPVPAARAWPAKLGPVGKALAVVAAALAAEAGLSRLRHKIGEEERSSKPAVQGVGSAPRGYLVGQSLEEVLVQTWDDSQRRAFARQEVRSFVATIVSHHSVDR